MGKRNGQSAAGRAFGVVLVIIGALLLLYVGVWATATVIRWSFDAGVCFLLACGASSLAFGLWLANGRASQWFQRHKVLRALFFSTLSVFLLNFLVVESFVLYGAGLRQSNQAADFLLVPGALVVDDRPSLILRQRLDGAVSWLQENPGATVIVSGGQGAAETHTEASVMKQYLIKMGIDQNRIIEEDQSSNTIENMEFSKQIMDKLAAGKEYRLMIVTSDFHMFRALLLARAQCIRASGISLPVHWTVKPICYSKEYFSVMKLLLTGMHRE